MAESCDMLIGQNETDDHETTHFRRVHVYVCSNGQETVHERNALMLDVQPALRRYCSEEYNVEFKLLDMRWEVPLASNDRRSRSDAPLQELNQMKRSDSLNLFLIIAGHAHGPSALPAAIPEEEFLTLRQALARRRNRKSRGSELLDEWYQRDTNGCLQGQFVLMSASSQDTSNSEECWEDVEQKLHSFLRLAAKYCHEENLLPIEVCHKYFVSQFEHEVRASVLENVDKMRDKTLLIMREIEDIRNYVAEPNINDFLEVGEHPTTDKVIPDENKAKYLEILLQESLLPELPACNVIRKTILWRYEAGVNPDTEMHREYLDDLASDVISVFKRMVDAHSYAYSDVKTNSLQDMSQHTSWSKKLAAEWFDINERTRVVQDYCTSENSQPLILHGVSGSGKSALIAKCSDEVHNWFDHSDDILVVKRFIGLTRNSANFRQCIKDIAEEIITRFNMSNDMEVKEAFDSLHTFQNLLKCIPRGKKIFLFLDGIDNFQTGCNSQNLAWLPLKLLDNVKIIVTLSTENKDYLNISGTDLQESNLYKLEEVKKDTAEKMLDFLLQKDFRQITSPQRKCISSLFHKCSLPMYVKIIFNISSNWNSYTELIEDNFSADITNIVSDLFGEWEEEFGASLTSHVASFITFSEDGLTDVELEDLLSLCDSVLQSIFREKIPSVYRIPPGILYPFMQKLRPYLYSKVEDNRTVFTWTHMIFKTITHQRYLYSGEIRTHYHNIFSDYYLGAWADKQKPLSTDNDIKNKDSDALDRRIPLQPLTYSRNGKIAYNKRKFSQLPKHLYHSNRLEELNKMVLYNFDWIFNKSKAMNLQATLDDISISQTPEARLIKEALISGEPIISKDVNNIAPELIGRLLSWSYIYPWIRNLIETCDEKGLSYNCFLPSFPYHHTPKTASERTLSLGNSPKCTFLSADNRLLYVKLLDKNVLNVINLTTGETEECLNTSYGEMKLTTNRELIVIYEKNICPTFKIHSMDGKFKGQIFPSKVFTSQGLKNTNITRIEKWDVSNDILYCIASGESTSIYLYSMATYSCVKKIHLESRKELVKFSHDYKHIYWSQNKTVHRIDTESPNYDSTPIIFTLEKTPAILLDSKKWCRLHFILQGENKVITFHDSEQNFDLLSTYSLTDYLENDSIIKAKMSSSETDICIIGEKTVLVYRLTSNDIIFRFNRPDHIPLEMNFSNFGFAKVNIADAEFTRDDKFLAVSILRDIYIYSLDYRDSYARVVCLQAPIGMISNLRTLSSNKLLTEEIISGDLLLWDIGEVQGTVSGIDKFTSPVVDLKVISESVMVGMQDSKEVGVVNLKTGRTSEILTHESIVTKFTMTSDGSFALVVVRPFNSGLFKENKIWDLLERRIIYEFENASSYSLAFKHSNVLISVHQISNLFSSPYCISQFKFEDENVSHIASPQLVSFIMKEPFITSNDHSLVILAAEDFLESDHHYVNPYICIFQFGEEITASTFGTDELSSLVSGKRILTVRECPSHPDRVIVIYTLLGNSLDDIHRRTDNQSVSICESLMSESHTSNNTDEDIPLSDLIGLLVLDLELFQVVHVCDAFLPPEEDVEALLFSPDLSYCMTSGSLLYDLETGQCLNKLHPDGLQPRAIILGGRVALFISGSQLSALRVIEGNEIGRVDVHGIISCVSVCPDDRTVLVGTQCGKVVGYTVVELPVDDRPLGLQQDNPQEIITQIPSRIASNNRESIEKKKCGEKRLWANAEWKIIFEEIDSDKDKTVKSWDRVGIKDPSAYTRSKCGHWRRVHMTDGRRELDCLTPVLRPTLNVSPSLLSKSCVMS